MMGQKDVLSGGGGGGGGGGGRFVMNTLHDWKENGIFFIIIDIVIIFIIV